MGRTVGKDGQCGAPQSVHSLCHVWKCRLPEVSLHESAKLRIACSDLHSRDRGTQRSLGDIPEVLVAFHERLNQVSSCFCRHSAENACKSPGSSAARTTTERTSNNVPYASKKLRPGVHLALRTDTLNRTRKSCSITGMRAVPLSVGRTTPGDKMSAATKRLGLLMISFQLPFAENGLKSYASLPLCSWLPTMWRG